MKTTKTTVVKEFDKDGKLLKHTETTVIEETGNFDLQEYVSPWGTPKIWGDAKLPPKPIEFWYGDICNQTSSIESNCRLVV